MVVAQQSLQLLRPRGLAPGLAAERGQGRFRGVPRTLGGLTCLVDRRVLVLGDRHSREGALQPPRRSPDRLGKHLARLSCRELCQRRIGDESVQVIEQLEIALPVKLVHRGVARLIELDGEVPGDAGLDRPHHQVRGDGGELGGEPGQQHLGVTGLPEHGRQPLQLVTQRPGPLPLDDPAERLQRAPGPAGRDPHLVHGVRLIPPYQGVVAGDGARLPPHIREHHIARGERAVRGDPPSATAPAPPPAARRAAGSRSPSARSSLVAVGAGRAPAARSRASTAFSSSRSPVTSSTSISSHEVAADPSICSADTWSVAISASARLASPSSRSTPRLVRMCTTGASAAPRVWARTKAASSSGTAPVAFPWGLPGLPPSRGRAGGFLGGGTAA